MRQSARLIVNTMATYVRMFTTVGINLMGTRLLLGVFDPCHRRCLVAARSVHGSQHSARPCLGGDVRVFLGPGGTFSAN